jgi:hypothetical protein
MGSLWSCVVTSGNQLPASSKQKTHTTWHMTSRPGHTSPLMKPNACGGFSCHSEDFLSPPCHQIFLSLILLCEHFWQVTTAIYTIHRHYFKAFLWPKSFWKLRPAVKEKADMRRHKFSLAIMFTCNYHSTSWVLTCINSHPSILRPLPKAQR